MLTNERRQVGRAMPRIDAPLKVTGRAAYAAEHSEPDMLHGAAVSATIARGRILEIDSRAAKAAFPGIAAIYTHENRPNAAWLDRSWQDETAPPGHTYRPLQNDRVLFDGQPVAFVVADSFENARDAAAMITVRYEVETPETDLTTKLAERYVPPKKRSGISPPPDPRGQPEEAFKEAHFRISGDYLIENEHHNPMELFATTVLYGADGVLAIHDKTQGSQNVQKFVCNVFSLSQDKVNVINAYVGGAFGSGLRPRHQLFFAVMASLDLKRSVKFEIARSDMFYLSYRPAMYQTVSLGADAQGRLTAVLHDTVQVTSRYEDYQEVVVNWSGLAYRCDNVALTYALTKLDAATPGDMRAPGAASGLFALESAMDELSYEVGIDPLELRRRNFVHFDQNENKQLTSKALRACYREGAARFGWERRQAKPRSMHEGHELIGWGMATGIWEAQLQSAKARVRMSANGQVIVQAAASDIGTGTYTILAQIAAEALDVPAEDVSVQIGQSDLPETSVEGGSWTAASSGSAVDAACLAIRQRLLDMAQKDDASPLKDATVEEVVIRDGHLRLDTDPRAGVAISELMARAGETAIEEEGKAGPDAKQMKSFASYTHSAVFVEVRVDEELGLARVTRVVSAVAAGRILNPKTARSQILGGVVMGLGMALHEESMIDHRSGRIMNHNLAEYHVPAHADIQDIDVHFVQEFDDKASPIGVKGLGEIGVCGVAAAVANAIFHATGKRIRHLPITIDKILGETVGKAA
ncbi:aldehyde oxidase [Xaviernesmea oryzae]|uniref:Aldehyde oxidase n=1 Tax=Xaviernesmea oryzae TaxID=464029 RepID=A0A1Q9B249_9HYPH|nr:xanthine dehydrogenase family protein molybdopterin-binding subunit [Xaviernesmea oryzae]OLP62076.1 aldehyde oxidase [Xaviernesmea oryzae]SEL86665.1 xanthine dehydrogenase YagR molybdenum-binding subunit [Xaviernesmea oryzae]